MTDAALTDRERHPLITREGTELLHRILQHPAAPRWNHRCGDRLGREGLRRVRAWERAQRAASRPGATIETPAWVERFAGRCVSEVPFYRRRGGAAARFRALPTCSRADLSREPWSFVPDGVPLEELIVYSTSGTTGHPLEILSHPVVSSLYLALLRAMLASRGVELAGGEGRTAIALVCFQASTYTYASISSFLGGAAFLKVNLAPGDWGSPADRARFLDDVAPAIYSGDPISLDELANLPLCRPPLALVSTSMSLHEGLRRRLETRFACPVLDVYSLNECRLVALGTPRGHEVFAHDLFVEVLRPDGSNCAPGERGEVTLTCGRNPFLPLLRYRTGDFAALDPAEPRPALVGLEGRPPVRFVAADGRRVNSIDVTQALQRFALAQFTLHQHADGSLLLRVRGREPDVEGLRAALAPLLGVQRPLTVAPLSGAGGKLLQYTSDLPQEGLP